jgi:hypothetical protein
MPYFSLSQKRIVIFPWYDLGCHVAVCLPVCLPVRFGRQPSPFCADWLSFIQKDLDSQLACGSGLAVWFNLCQPTVYPTFLVLKILHGWLSRLRFGCLCFCLEPLSDLPFPFHIFFIKKRIVKSFLLVWPCGLSVMFGWHPSAFRYRFCWLRAPSWLSGLAVLYKKELA